MLKKIEFEGMEFEYDPKEAGSYRNIKRIARAQKDMGGFFDAFEAIFAGHDDEYAELLGNSFEKLGLLASECINASGAAAKN